MLQYWAMCILRAILWAGDFVIWTFVSLKWTKRNERLECRKALTKQNVLSTFGQELMDRETKTKWKKKNSSLIETLLQMSRQKIYILVHSHLSNWKTWPYLLPTQIETFSLLLFYYLPTWQVNVENKFHHKLTQPSNVAQV